MSKCCTKKPNCKKQPTCNNKMDSKTFWSYFTIFNIFLVILRLLIIKKEDIASIGPSYEAHFWFYLKFILFLELQLFAIYCLYLMTFSFYNTIKKNFKHLVYYFKELIGIRITNPFMLWLTLINTDWFIYKCWCLFCVWLFASIISFLIGFYISMVLLFGPYLLGYYSI